MSRIGRKPVALPKGVTAQLDGHKITVKGPKGEISRTLHEDMALALEDGTVVVKRPSDESRHKALHGLTRDRKSTRLNSSHQIISYAVFCLKKKKKKRNKIYKKTYTIRNMNTYNMKF